MPAETRALAESFDSAVDKALSSMGQAPDPTDSPEPVEAAPVKGEEATEPEGDEAAPTTVDPEADLARQRVERARAAREKIESDANAHRAARVEKYGDFLADIEGNPSLRDHILKFWNQEPSAGPGPGPVGPVEKPEDDPLAGYDERDRKALQSYHDRREQALLQKIQQIVAPFQEQLTQGAADREIGDLGKDYPDWEKWVSRKELAEIRQQFPQLSLKAAYRIAAFDQVRGRVSNADRQMAKVRDVLDRKQPAESQPRRHVKVEKRETSFDEGFDRAYAQAKAAWGSPGR